MGRGWKRDSRCHDGGAWELASWEEALGMASGLVSTAGAEVTEDWRKRTGMWVGAAIQTSKSHQRLLGAMRSYAGKESACELKLSE